MKVIRDKEYVNRYHFDMRNFKMEEEHGTPKTQYNVEFHLVEKNMEEQSTTIILVLHFMNVQETFVVSGAVSQQIKLTDGVVNEPSELSDEDKRMLALPLFDMVNRLTYEVTEVAFDAPGIDLGEVR
ncbi:DUF1149 family protein [Streptococcus minor]|uniref:DUF1149 family protein n=1 Tax=Streptococcus minor TaxID=229549 RepID=A0A3P1VDQ4_9STRE|nr:DUF1149 family protein [Streptococcus minor]RRD32324.1 DUF1149 family protein [Streptococcus minor]